MKVLLMPHRFGPHGRGGVETWAEQLRAALQLRGHEVAVLTRDDRPDGPALGTLVEESRDGRIWWLAHRHRDGRRFGDSWRDPRLLEPLRAVFDAERPDAVHLGHPDGWGVIPTELAAERGVPVVATLHDYKWLCARGQLIRDDATCEGPSEDACVRCVSGQLGRGPARAAAGRLWARWLPQRAPDPPSPSMRARGRWRSRRDAMRAALSRARLTSPSAFVADWHQQRLGQPVAHVPNGVAGEPLRPPGRAPGPLRLGFFGTDAPTKGLPLLLELAARRPDLELHVHGPTPRTASANVRWHGPYPAEEAVVRMATVDAVAMPSTWPENAPYVALEARLAGRPLLVSAVGGLPEFVHDGVDGRVLPPGDRAAWSEAVDLDRLAALAAGVRPPPTADAMAAAFEAIYAGVDADRAGTGPDGGGSAL